MPVMIRFHEGRALSFSLYLAEQEANAEAALLRAGIDVAGKRPQTRAPGAVWWRRGTMDGIRYTKVGAIRGIIGEGDGFDLVQAEFP
jgi:predicted cupin superfamily sugar epimerase